MRTDVHPSTSKHLTHNSQAHPKWKLGDGYRGFWEESVPQQSIEVPPQPKMLTSCPQNELNAKEDMEAWEKQNPKPEYEKVPADADRETATALTDKNFEITLELERWERMRAKKFQELKKIHKLTGHDDD